MSKPWKHWYVRDKNGNIEMEIFPVKYDDFTVSVHYPSAETFPENTPLLARDGMFHKMRLCDFGYMLMAYSETEFRRFNEFLKEVMKDGEQIS